MYGLKQRIVNSALIVITEVTEITECEILSKNRTTEVVDARHILVKLLYEKGLYIAYIAKQLNLTKKQVCNIITQFDNRIKQSVICRKNYEITKNKLCNNLE